MKTMRFLMIIGYCVTLSGVLHAADPRCLSNANRESFSPSISIDPNGARYVVWESCQAISGTTEHHVVMAELPDPVQGASPTPTLRPTQVVSIRNGTPWPAISSNDTPTPRIRPQVAADPNWFPSPVGSPTPTPTPTVGTETPTSTPWPFTPTPRAHVFWFDFNEESSPELATAVVGVLGYDFAEGSYWRFDHVSGHNESLGDIFAAPIQQRPMVGGAGPLVYFSAEQNDLNPTVDIFLNILYQIARNGAPSFCYWLGSENATRPDYVHASSPTPTATPSTTPAWNRRCLTADYDLSKDSQFCAFEVEDAGVWVYHTIDARLEIDRSPTPTPEPGEEGKSLYSSWKPFPQPTWYPLDSGNDSRLPFLKLEYMDDDYDIKHITYIRTYQSTVELVHRYWDADDGWTAPVVVDDDVDEIQPSMDVDVNGNVYIAYAKGDTPQYSIINGLGVSIFELNGSLTFTDIQAVDVAAEPTGNQAQIVFSGLQSGAGAYKIYWATIDAD